MPVTLSNPNLQVNDVSFAYVPDSLSYKEGKGNKNVRAQTSGGNAISTVVAEDATTKKSMVKFKLENTEANLNIVNTWSASNANTIQLSGGGIQVAFRQMVVTEEPERVLGADGNLEITFEGAPVV